MKERRFSLKIKVLTSLTIYLKTFLHKANKINCMNNILNPTKTKSKSNLLGELLVCKIKYLDHKM